MPPITVLFSALLALTAIAAVMLGAPGAGGQQPGLIATPTPEDPPGIEAPLGRYEEPPSLLPLADAVLAPPNPREPKWEIQAQPAGPVDLDLSPPPRADNPKLQTSLGWLSAVIRAYGPLGAEIIAPTVNVPLEDGAVRIIAEAQPGRANEVSIVAASLGIPTEGTYQNLVQLLSPVQLLETLAESPEVSFLRLPLPVQAAVNGQGVGLIGADAWQTAGFTGTGVKVAIVDLGFAGYTGLLGDQLPGSVVTRSCRADGDITGGGQPHGTAVAEIIHEVAPDAQLYLINFLTEVEFASCVTWLKGQGVDIVNHSVGWFNSGPLDGTGPINDIVNGATSQGILWVKSAGNSAQRHWNGPWDDPDGDAFLNFLGIDETNQFSASAGELVRIYLQWNDPWGASCNDYDLYVYDSTLSSIVASSLDAQTCSQDPTEAVAFFASYTGVYHTVVREFSSTTTPKFDLFWLGPTPEYVTASKSITIPGDNANVLTVGAVPWFNPTMIESFSSQGPTQDGRIKPDIVGPDQVKSVTYGSFAGTSASAPHAAGAAALVAEWQPGWSQSQIRAFLISGAVDIGAPGDDNIYGAGRLDLGAPKSTGTPTTTPTATSTATSATSGPEMALKIKSPLPGSCLGDKCTLDLDQPFTLSVDIVTGPVGGYVGVQSFIVFGSDLIYKPADPAVEIIWPDLEPALAVSICSQSPPCTASGPAGEAAHGGLTGLLSLPTSTFTGNYLDLSFNCSSSSSQTVVQLLDLNDPAAGTSGAGFALPPSGATLAAAKTNSLTINCGTPPTATLTPTVTHTVTPTPTTTNTGTPTPTNTPTATPTPTDTPTTMPTVTSTPTNTPTSTPTTTPTATATSTPTATATPTPTNTPTTTATPTPTSTPGMPDLVLTQIDSLDPVSSEGEYLYTLLIDNAGQGDASGVVVDDVLGELQDGSLVFSIEPVAPLPAGCTFDALTHTVRCDVGDILAGESRQVNLLVLAPMTLARGSDDNQTLTTCGMVDPDAAIAELNENNNADCEETTVLWNCPDHNGDGEVSLPDLAFIALHWRHEIGVDEDGDADASDRQADLDMDGTVGLVDLALVALHWRETCPSGSSSVTAQSLTRYRGIGW